VYILMTWRASRPSEDDDMVRVLFRRLANGLHHGGVPANPIEHEAADRTDQRVPGVSLQGGLRKRDTVLVVSVTIGGRRPQMRIS
jgi:hypothetical protein